MFSLPTRRRPSLEMLEDRTVPTAGWALGFGHLAYDVAVDEAGNVYAAGDFEGTRDFDPGPGVTNLTSVGGYDGFLVKFAADGSFQWATRFGGSDYDFTRAIALSEGTVYVGGMFRGGTAEFGTLQLVSSAYECSFLIKVDAAGAVQQALPVNSTGNNSITDLAIDPSGDIVATGLFTGTADFDPGPSADQITAVGGDNTFVWKLDGDGNHLWVRAGTNGDNDGHGVTADSLGNLYVFGSGTGSFGAFSVAGSTYVAKLDAAGAFLWAKPHSLTADGSPSSHSLAVDDSDPNPANWSVYFTGRSTGAVLPVGIVVVKLQASDAGATAGGTVLWEKVLAGTTYGWNNAYANTNPNGIAVAPGGDVYVWGTFESQFALDFDPGPMTAHLSGQPSSNPDTGFNDAFLLRLNGNGEYVSARRMGGDETDVARAAVVGADGLVYVAGQYRSSSSGTFDVGHQTVTLTQQISGRADAFLVKLDPTYGAVTGRVVHDANGNGSGDDEPFGLEGWTVYLDQNDNDQLDPGETSTTTDWRGVYTLPHLTAGTYTVAVVPQDGWVTPGSATTTMTGDGRFFQHTFVNTTAPVVRTYSATAVPVPTKPFPGLSITIPDDVNILDLDVALSVTHNRLQDLYIDLTGPDGVKVRFAWYRDTGKNFTNTIFDMDASQSITEGSAPYTGRFRPHLDTATYGNMATLEWWDGQLAAGTWTLGVIDNTSAGGTITNWSLQITTAPDGPPPPPEISIDDVSVTEGNAGTTTATFTVSLSGASAQTVTVNYATADGTATVGNSDYAPLSDVLTFLPGQTSKTVTVTVYGDAAAEANETFVVNLSGATNATLADAQGVGTILDDDSTKFFVVDDASANRTYRYSAPGAALGDNALNSGNAAPRGAASNPAGDRVWVVDVNKTVYVYNAAGTLLGSWAAGGLASNAQVEGVAVAPNGTDVWLVDNRQDRVYRYTGAATRLSGSQSAASSFALNSGNGQPRDVVTDGTSLWVVNDAATDKVFKYTVAGTLLGSWTLTGAGGTPTGITLDPSAPAHLWVVDSGTDRVYQFDNAVGRTSGSQAASGSFALAAGNANPQGIADPPPGSAREPAGVARVAQPRSRNESARRTDAGWLPGRSAAEVAALDRLWVEIGQYLSRRRETT